MILCTCDKEACNDHAILQEALQIIPDKTIPEDGILNHESVVIELWFESGVAVVEEVKNEPDSNRQNDQDRQSYHYSFTSNWRC